MQEINRSPNAAPSAEQHPEGLTAEEAFDIATGRRTRADIGRAITGIDPSPETTQAAGRPWERTSRSTADVMLGYVRGAEAEIAQVKTPDDAEAFWRAYGQPFTRAYFEGASLSGAEAQEILAGARKLRTYLVTLNETHQIPGEKDGVYGYERHLENLDHVITNLTQDTSYAGQKMNDVIDNELSELTGQMDESWRNASKRPKGF